MSSNPAIVIGVDAVNKASAVLQQVDTSIQKTTSGVETSSAKVSAASEKVASKITRSYQNIAMSITGLAVGITSFVTSFNTLEKAQYSADKATLTYNKSLERLRQMQQDGTATQKEYENQVELVSLNLERQRLAQDSLSDTTLNFYAQMPATLLSFGVAAFSAYSAYTASAGMATTATRTFDIAAKIAFLTNPAFLAIGGVVTLIVLLATNTFGLRDAFVSAGQAVLDFFDRHIRPFMPLLGLLIDGFKALGAMIGEGVKPALAETSPIIDEYTTYTVKAADETKTFEKYLEGVADKAKDARQEIEFYVWSLGSVVDTTKFANEELEFYTEYLQDAERDAKKLRQENFNLVASLYGVENALHMNDDQLTKVADRMRANIELTKQYDEALKRLQNTRDKDEKESAGFGDSGDGKIDRGRGKDLAEAREKYGDNIPLIWHSGNYVPRTAHLLKQRIASENSQLQLMQFKQSKNYSDIRAGSIEDQQALIGDLRSRYNTEMANLNLQVNIAPRSDGGYEVDAKLSDARGQTLRTSSQTPAGASNG